LRFRSASRPEGLDSSPPIVDCQQPRLWNQAPEGIRGQQDRFVGFEPRANQPAFTAAHPSAHAHFERSTCPFDEVVLAHADLVDHSTQLPLGMVRLVERSTREGRPIKKVDHPVDDDFTANRSSAASARILVKFVNKRFASSMARAG
jgi:hypothetical protein